MPIQSSGLALNIATFSARLLEQREVSPRSRIVAQAISDAFPGTAINVYVTASLADGDAWTAIASAGEAAIPEARIPLQSGTLGILAKEPKPLLFEGATLSREEYAHVNVRRTLHSLSYLPLIQDELLVGAIEILSFESTLSEEQLESLVAVAEVASAALHAAQTYQEEHHNTLGSITRLTQLYDIEKVFSSTLEMDQLLPIIGSKVREMLDCEAVNLWLLEPDESLRLMHQAGEDLTVREGASQRPGEGLAGDVSDNGEPVLIEHSKDERLVRRNQSIEEGGVVSLIVAPIMDRESLVGVIEATNKLDGTPFDDDDLFTLCRLTESASRLATSARQCAPLVRIHPSNVAHRQVVLAEDSAATSNTATSEFDHAEVSQWYASRIRQGYRPHPRHLNALAELLGINDGG
jgi:GAF domain-containing protein